MMLGFIRRRVASGSSSASISGLSRTVQSGALVCRGSTVAVVESLTHPRVFEGVRNFSQLFSPGTLVSAKTLRCIAGSWPGVIIQNRSKPFSSDSGDSVDAVVPFMGESITDGTLAKFLKNPGDRVEADEPIAQIETDKVTIDVPSPESGVLEKFVAKEGDTVEPGHKVAVISKSGEGSSRVAQPEKAAMQPSPSVETPKPKGGSVDAVVPFMGESITDGILAKFLKNPGDRVVADELIAQIETDKVTIDVLSPEAGVLEKFLAKEGDTVEPGLKVAVISTSGEGIAHNASSEKTAEKAVTQPKLKAETARAVEKSKPKPSSPPPSRHTASEPQLPPKERERRVAMTRLRKRVAARLKDSQNSFALLSTFNEVDMTNLMKLRSEYKDAFYEKHGVKLGFMSGFVKAAVSALQHQPIVNAVIDGDDIVYRDHVDISIAVGTPKGLVVPVLRNAERMNFAEIEKEINKLAKKANAGSISIDEMAGGSFTISNGGVYGSLLSTPIINPPQSAILGMHSIVKRAMVVGGNIAARPMMYIALTYDHRLVDGREAVLFLRHIKDVVEDPRRLLLDV